MSNEASSCPVVMVEVLSVAALNMMGDWYSDNAKGSKCPFCEKGKQSRKQD